MLEKLDEHNERILSSFNHSEFQNKCNIIKKEINKTK